MSASQGPDEGPHDFDQLGDEVEINHTKVKFHIEGTSGVDPTKPNGLLGVDIDGNRLTGAATFVARRANNLVRATDMDFARLADLA
jgi:hypothetical protein